jgi:N6-L-threonylcarbamoyladenine synthase
VSANSGLRNAAIRWAEEEGLNLYIPGLEYSTDNAAMIAMAAHFKYLKGDFASLDISPEPRLPI